MQLPLNKQLHALLSQTGLSNQKANLVLSFSNGRSESSRDLTDDECRQMIGWLRAQLNGSCGTNHGTGQLNGSCGTNHGSANKMRRAMISHCYEMGWTVTNDKGERVADMKRLDAWCINRGYLKKKLNAYTLDELRKLKWQFDKVYDDFLKAV